MDGMQRELQMRFNGEYIQAFEQLLSSIDALYSEQVLEGF